MVFEYRSATAVVHRAPPLPISSSRGKSRRSSGYARLSSGRQCRAAGGAYLSPSSLRSSSYTNSHLIQTPPKTPPTATSTPSKSSSQQQQQQVAAASKAGSRRPLTIEEYERDFRQSASELELTERVFRGGLSSNPLRAALWPHLFGLVGQRGRFVWRPCANGNGYAGPLRPAHQRPAVAAAAAAGPDANYVYLEHEDNAKRWRELEKQYRIYENQWKSIQPDQELRFSTFRERKSLIERDVVRSDRTHPFYSSHNQNYAENLTNLTKVLMTYMMYDFDIGYLQGMSDLAAPILYVFQGDLVKSFWVFVEVMKLFRRNFEFSQKTIHFQLNCLFRLIKMTDPKLANHLRETETSNCFFVFRHIVCQFKRELMRESSGGSSGSSPADSSSSNDDEEEPRGPSDGSAPGPGPSQLARDDYANVLNLWDTIWFVQRRHELRARSSCVHTYKISNGSAKGRAAHGSTRRCPHYSDSDGGLSLQSNHCNSHSNNYSQNTTTTTTTTSNNNNNNLDTSQAYRKGAPSSASAASSAYLKSGERSRQQAPTRKGSSAGSNSNSSLASSADSSLSSASAASLQEQSCAQDSCSLCCARLGTTRSSCGPAPKVKQEQVVYTKETFYSSFDPNQADVPRFYLTETEKFVISLCWSLIKRERNHILQNRLDASEIHQHFIRPRLASDLDQFVARSYELYHYLNHECDLQSLVKRASEFADPSECSPMVPPASGLANGRPFGALEQASSSAATADTYELLKDYFIISPTTYNLSQSSLSSLAGLASPADGLSPLAGRFAFGQLRRKASSGALVGSHRSWDTNSRLVSSTPNALGSIR